MVGATGRGKSSLMSLLLGQETPTAGAIYFLNTDNRVAETRIAASIVYLSQHAPILNGDLTDNITLGGADTTNRLQHVIEAVGLSELRTRKFGVDGTALSGGERRKINVARFLFHIIEREYFIIDEAFLGMDGVTRKRLLHLVKTAIGTKTGIVISHNADVIDLLSDRVVYIPGDGTPLTGTHAELARDDSSYRAILNVDSIAGFGHV